MPFKILILSCLLAGLLLLAHQTYTKQPILKRTISQATAHTPEYFTELYFNDYATFTKKIEVDKEYSGTFSVVNHESTDRSYTYKMLILRNGKVTSIVKRSVYVKQRQSQTIKFIYSANAKNQQVEAVIRFDEMNQQIHVKFSS